MKKLFPVSLLALGMMTACSEPAPHEVTDVSAQYQSATDFVGDVNIWPQINSEVKADAEIEARIDTILSQMSLEHKVAQMVQGEIRHVTPEDVEKYRLGSVLNGGGSFPNGERYASIDEWLAIADGYWEASNQTDVPHEPIPLIWGTDAVHGHNNVVGAVLFPHNMGLGAAGNPELMRGIGEATARQVIATGIDWTFAPTVAVAMDYRWGRSYESYGQDPQMVHDYAYEMVASIQGANDDERFQDGHIVSTIKHFVGDGGTTKGIDQGNTVLSEQELFDIHAQGYVGGLTAGAQTVMASFNTWNGDKLHGHHYMLTTVLKEQMGFDGFVVGDWNGHGQVPGCGNDHCATAINAGVDMIMVPENWEAFLLNTIEDVKEGRITQARVDDAVRRILRVKLRAGMFEADKPSARYLAGSEDALWGEDVKNLARDAVRQSLVLLKNDGDVLPLDSAQNVLITGNVVGDISRQMGGWSVTWQGTETDKKDFPNATDVSESLAEAIAANGSDVTLAKPDAIDLTKDYDVAVVLFGETPYAEFNGDRSNLIYSIQDEESIELLKTLKASGTKVVSIFVSGRPMWLNPEINESDAFVAAWLPGTEGAGVAEVVTGEYDFSGRLPGVWPLSTDVTSTLAIGAGGDYATGNAPISGDLDASFQIDASDDSISIFQGVVANGMELNATNLDVRVADFKVQEDARRLTFAENGLLSFGFDGEPENATNFRQDTARIVFSFKVLEAADDASLALSIKSQRPEDALDISPILGLSAEYREWSVPLYCVIKDVSSFTTLEAPFQLEASAGTKVEIADVRWEFSEEEDYSCANVWAGESYFAPEFTPRSSQ